MALLPLVLRAPWREKFAWAAAFFIPAVVLSQAWKAIAELRYGDAVTLSPSTGLLALAALPVPFLLPAPWRLRVGAVMGVLVIAAVAIKGLPGQSPAQYTRSVIRNESNQFVYRSFELDRIIAPENGPASRRLARVVERDLLPREPYRSYGIDVHEFFASGSDRVFGDLTGVASPADLAEATREAIRRHPGTFVRSIGRTLWDQLANRPVYGPEAVASPATNAAGQAGETPSVVVEGRRLPKPTEGQPIPASAIGPMLWTIGGPAQEVWTSATEHSFVFTDPRDERRFQKLGSDVGRLSSRLPTRDGSPMVIHRLNQVSHRFPPLIVWLLIGVVALALRRPRNALVAIAPCLAGLVVIVATALVAPSVPEYAAPVSPAFLMLAAVGLVGVPARSRRSAVDTSWSSAAGLAVGVGAAAWAVKIYVERLKGFVDGAGAAQRSRCLPARGRKSHRHGIAVRVPRATRRSRTRRSLPGSSRRCIRSAVPPPASCGRCCRSRWWPLRSGCSSCATGAAMRLRSCFSSRGARSTWARSSRCCCSRLPRRGAGAIGSWTSVGAVALAIVLKLFLWPLAVWLALTRRLRDGLAAVALA